MPIHARHGSVTLHAFVQLLTVHTSCATLVYNGINNIRLCIGQLTLFMRYFHVIYFFHKNSALFYIIYCKKLRYSHL